MLLKQGWKVGRTTNQLRVGFKDGSRISTSYIILGIFMPIITGTSYLYFYLLLILPIIDVQNNHRIQVVHPFLLASLSCMLHTIPGFTSAT